ncbi:LysR family transcriptional regulator [Paraburkholderia flava]|uniref:LysR family transcriptional regulator n=1 Tax=Paraburkholderia flava TaxID=2547393 RepID=UPI001F0E0362|nr:LysR family transcriptional regulator [Paraburkholderia flava]
MTYWGFYMNDRPGFTELTAFTAIVRHASFRAAADELGLSASTLSHMMRALEERLGIRLFNRTTRSVAPTEAGARFFRNLSPILNGLDVALADVGTLSERPAGRLRINASETATRILMQTIVPTFIERFPNVHLDLVTEGRLIDIVAEGFDAGVRLGESLPQDMIAVPFGGGGRFIVVAAPAYLERHGVPDTPDDLGKHQCVRFRLPSGKMYRWEFERHGQSLKIEVSGPITLDHVGLMVDAAVKGVGLAYVLAEIAQDEIDSGRLVCVLQDWTPPVSGHHLYYPSSRLVPGALRAFIDVLREMDDRGVSNKPARSRIAPPAKKRGKRPGVTG